jgi:pimeloyl-ACP methyl ester carboxylesterase
MEPPYEHPVIGQAYFFPTIGPRPSGTHGGEAIDLPDGVVAYWHHPLPGAPTLLYFHGNGERIAHQLRDWPGWLEQLGVNGLFVDYPGYGASAGSPSLASCARAARHAADWLAARDDVPAILIAGRSVGSLFALEAARWRAEQREGEPAGLLLESGVADVVQRLALRVPYEALGLDRGAIERAVARDFDHRAKLAALRCPVLVLHCREDWLVPVEHGQQLARWAGDQLLELMLFERGDHNTIQFENEPEYRAALGRLVSAALANAADEA